LFVFPATTVGTEAQSPSPEPQPPSQELDEPDVNRKGKGFKTYKKQKTE
jgi:hypothetical protein